MREVISTFYHWVPNELHLVLSVNGKQYVVLIKSLLHIKVGGAFKGSSFLAITVTDISNTTTIVPCNYSNKMGNNKSTNCLINTQLFYVLVFSTD